MTPPEESPSCDRGNVVMGRGDVGGAGDPGNPSRMEGGALEAERWLRLGLVGGVTPIRGAPGERRASFRAGGGTLGRCGGLRVR